MAGESQEHHTFNMRVIGSSPLGGPTVTVLELSWFRASPLQGEGHPFKSDRDYRE